jgi:DNA repair protein RadD
MTTLRPYQRDAINATLDYWAEGGGNPLVVMATGTGKSVVIATAVRELLESFPDMRVIMLTHVKELVAQNAKAMLAAWPQAPIGINSAGLGRRDKRSQVLFASIQSVHKESAATLGKRDLILVDEAHLIPRAGSGMYLSFIERMREDVPDLRVAGYTATPYRLGSGRLDMGEDRIFDKIVYDYGIGEGIRDGYLSPLVSKATATALDLSGVKRAGGEFVAASLEAAIDQDWITESAVDEMVAFGENRRSWLAFAAGVDHAFHLRDAIRRRGISCETVTGETPNGERDRIIRDFKEGRTRCLTNVGVLTTGFDAPSVDLVAMLRPDAFDGLVYPDGREIDAPRPRQGTTHLFSTSRATCAAMVRLMRSTSQAVRRRKRKARRKSTKCAPRNARTARRSFHSTPANAPPAAIRGRRRKRGRSTTPRQTARRISCQ